MLTIRRTVAEGVRMCTAFRDPEQDRSERHAAAAGDLQQVERDVGGVRRRHYQQIRLALQPRERERAHPHFLVQRRVAVHLAFDLELRIHPLMSASAACIFFACGCSLLPKLECESSATFGVMPKRRISSAASSVISAMSSAVGSMLT